MVEALLVEAPDFSQGKRHASSEGLEPWSRALKEKKRRSLLHLS